MFIVYKYNIATSLPITVNCKLSLRIAGDCPSGYGRENHVGISATHTTKTAMQFKKLLPAVIIFYFNIPSYFNTDIMLVFNYNLLPK